MPDIHILFQRALQRDPVLWNGVSGEECMDSEGNCAVFSIRCVAGRIEAAGYRCTGCITLVALCQHLAEWMPGRTACRAAGMEESELLHACPGIPPERRKRAALAASAMRSAAEQYVRSQT